MTHNREFDAVFKSRNSSGGAIVVVYGLPNGLEHNRLGLSVGRRFGGAVMRNRFKRLCREAFRLSGDRQPQGWDWIILPSKRRRPDPAGVETPASRLEWLQADILEQMRRIERQQARRTQTS